ncbi:uncharacterized protein LOC134727027 [Mytilus trossulus]|uniref:uncharacterized protein LOC134727027 n=1 Tax=Mytilus trossulus TaxID=6551 RepID=UPI0030063BFF
MAGKHAIITGLVAIVGLFYLSSVNGLSCLFCDSVVNITDCLTQKALCTDNDEQCFLDKVILPDLSTVFSAGCRSKQVCDLITSSVGRKRSTVACAECCDLPVDNSTLIPCNGYLCNQKPQPTQATCGVCDKVTHPEDCSVDQQCQPTEVCKINTVFTGGVIKHELGCEQKTVCDVLLTEYRKTHSTALPAAGRRADHGDLVLCSACCDTLSCNKKPCKDVRETQKCHDTAICG